MADIVWNLRNDVPCNGDIGCAWELCHQAATEIERLRAALERLVVCCENDFNGGKTLIRRDVIEARAALEEGRT